MELLIPDWTDIPANVGALSTMRGGGVSRGPYDDGHGGGGLNLGVHVRDELAHVQRNRALLRSILPAEPSWLTQVHGVNVADAAQAQGAPDADACIASEPGAVCVMMTADCLPVLLCDAAGSVVGAAHAGWKGALHGVTDATIAAMEALGGRRDRIAAAVGPCIARCSYEVDEAFRERFLDEDEGNARFFDIDEKPRFDVAGYVRHRLLAAGVEQVEALHLDTYADADRFFSYRRATHRGEADYGRQLSAIALP